MRTALASFLTLALAGAAAAQPPDFAKVEILVEKVAGSVYMLTGAGGNIGLSIGPGGVVVVDDQFAPLVPRIREAIRKITDAPIRFVLTNGKSFTVPGEDFLWITDDLLGIAHSANRRPACPVIPPSSTPGRSPRSKSSNGKPRPESP